MLTILVISEKCILTEFLMTLVLYHPIEFHMANVSYHVEGLISCLESYLLL